jgi:hypothetical protein
VPFIACLNNVKTTHAAQRNKRRNKPKNTPTHPQSRASRTAFRHHPPPGKEDNQAAPKHNYTYSQQRTTTSQGRRWARREDARVHYADLKQQPHQHPRHTPGMPRAKGRTRRLNHPRPQQGRAYAADPSGPNSVPDPTPTNAGHEYANSYQEAAVTVDDSTSETPPCASEHSPLVGACAP